MNIARRHGLVFRNVRRTAPLKQALDTRQVLLEGVNEREFQEHVLTSAAHYGWHGMHIFNSRGVIEGVFSPNRPFPRRDALDDAFGFPDLVLIHPGRDLLILAELKVKERKLRAGQERWKLWCSGLKHDARYFTWWPKDEAEIEQILSQGWAP
jgi:hypothetical protein